MIERYAILVRLVRWTSRGREYEADPKRRKIIIRGIKRFGEQRAWGKEDKEEPGELEDLDKGEAKKFRKLNGH